MTSNMGKRGPAAAEEAAGLEVLRSGVRDLLNPDKPYDAGFNLLRWLRSREPDIVEEGAEEEQELAEEERLSKILHRLRKHLKFRRVFGLDDVAERLEPSRMAAECFPLTVLGRAGKGSNRLVMVEPVGRVDIPGILRGIQVYRFLEQRFLFMERLYQQMKEEEEQSGEPSAVHYIMDLEGLQMDGALISAVTGPYRILWSRIGDNYVEWIDQFLVINAPTFLSTLFSALSPFMPAGTLEKLQILGEDWRERLQELIDPECLPEEYGGTNPTAVTLPLSPVPEELLWEPKSEEEDPDAGDWDSVEVPAGEKATFSRFVLDANQRLRITTFGPEEFTLAVYHCSDPKEKDTRQMSEVLPHSELPGMASTDTLIVPLQESGIYHVVLGNEKAWWYPVTVKLRLAYLDEAGEPSQTIDVDQQ